MLSTGSPTVACKNATRCTLTRTVTSASMHEALTFAAQRALDGIDEAPLTVLSGGRGLPGRRTAAAADQDCRP